MSKEKSQVIRKYPVYSEVSMPIGAKIIRLGMQNGIAYFWVLCNRGIAMENRKFDLVFTEHHFDSSNRKYIDSFVECSEGLMCHVFERLNKEAKNENSK